MNLGKTDKLHQH